MIFLELPATNSCLIEKMKKPYLQLVERGKWGEVKILDTLLITDIR
jgi:hypothetical protein